MMLQITWASVMWKVLERWRYERKIREVVGRSESDVRRLWRQVGVRLGIGVFVLGLCLGWGIGGSRSLG